LTGIRGDANGEVRPGCALRAREGHLSSIHDCSPPGQSAFAHARAFCSPAIAGCCWLSWRRLARAVGQPRLL